MSIETLPSADDFLMGGGVPSAKFPQIGAKVTGSIAREPEVQQQTDFDSGKPMFWDDGKPKLQAKVVLQTNERDPADPEDDGQRAVYIKGQMQKAIATAVRAAGAKRLEVGGTLTVTYAADGERKGKLNPPKVYTASYESPNALAIVAEPATSDDSPPPGIDPTAWANLGPEQRKNLRAAMGQSSQPPF